MEEVIDNVLQIRATMASDGWASQWQATVLSDLAICRLNECVTTIFITLPHILHLGVIGRFKRLV